MGKTRYNSGRKGAIIKQIQKKGSSYAPEPMKKDPTEVESKLPLLQLYSLERK